MNVETGPGLAASPTAPPWYERRWHWAAAGIVLVTVVIGLSLVSSVWLASPDSVKYADTARALARGEGYLFNGGREGKHPPGFPALLALLFRTTSDPFLLARIMLVLTAGAALYLAATILRRVLGAGVSLIALVCVAASVQLWWSTQFILSEYPYAVFQNLALILLIRLAASESPRRRDAPLFGLATGAAMLIRPIGVTLIAACAYVILRKRLTGRLTTARAAALSASAVGIPVLAFGAWRTYAAVYVGAAVPENVNILMRGYATAGGASAGSVIVQTAKNMLSQAGGLIFGEIIPPQYPSVEPSLWAALLLIWLPVPVALVVRGLGRAEPLWAFLCVYLSTVALWPLASDASARLCWPVAPFIAGLLLWSYRWLAGRVWHRKGPVIVSTVIVVGVVTGQATLGGRLWEEMRAGEAFCVTRLADLARIRDGFHPAPPDVWANLNVRETVFVFDMPTTVMELTWNKLPERWVWELDEYRPDYIVVPNDRGNTRRFLETLSRVRPTAVRVVELETVSVYHVPRAASPHRSNAPDS